MTDTRILEADVNVETFDAYDDLATSTRVYPVPLAQLPIYPALAMCGEAGEFAEKVKKAWRDGTELNREDALKELGDVLWYISAAAHDLGSSLEDVAQMNLAKLRGRMQRGTLGGAGDRR